VKDPIELPATMSKRLKKLERVAFLCGMLAFADPSIDGWETRTGPIPEDIHAAADAIGSSVLSDTEMVVFRRGWDNGWNYMSSLVCARLTVSENIVLDMLRATGAGETKVSSACGSVSPRWVLSALSLSGDGREKSRYVIQTVT
jgi:hypothetical protein